MNIKEEFKYFLKTGSLKHFPYGMEEEKIIYLLGEPDEQVENEETSMIKYDRIEFYFYKGDKESKRLFGILIMPVSVSNNRSNLSMEYSWLDKELNDKQVRKHLIREGIAFDDSVSDYNKMDMVLKTEGEVVFFFSKQNHKINKVGRFLPMHAFEKI